MTLGGLQAHDFSSRDDKFVATLISHYLADLSSRPERSVAERSAVALSSQANLEPTKHAIFVASGVNSRLALGSHRDARGYL
jgi:hypothetical protein